MSSKILNARSTSGMPDISSLNSQVQQLRGASDFWDRVVARMLFLTAFVAVAYFITTMFQASAAKRLRTAQDLLIQAKDRQLAPDLAAKDVEIGNANATAGAANERAADASERASANEKEAARLQKLAEDEKLARVRLERGISARRLTGTQKETISKSLAPGHPWKVAVVSVVLDGESEDFADDIAGAMSAPPSKWLTMRIKNHATTRTGVEIAWLEGTEDFNRGVGSAGRRLGLALEAAGIDWTPYVITEREQNTAVPEFQMGVLYLLVNRKPAFKKP
jgi:hypothetical protein